MLNLLPLKNSGEKKEKVENLADRSNGAIQGTNTSTGANRPKRTQKKNTRGEE